jgi:hypothetical protein
VAGPAARRQGQPLGGGGWVTNRVRALPARKAVWGHDGGVGCSSASESASLHVCRVGGKGP